MIDFEHFILVVAVVFRTMHGYRLTREQEGSTEVLTRM